MLSASAHAGDANSATVLSAENGGLTGRLRTSRSSIVLALAAKVDLRSQKS